MRIHAFLEHWGLINFNFDVKNHNFNSITSSIDQSINNFEVKIDPLLKEKRRIDPNSESDPYLHTLLSISRKIRPVCDYSGLPCGTVWYIRTPAPEEINTDDPERKDYNDQSVIILSQESFEAGKIPKCFDPKSFKRETLAEKLEKANRGKAKWTPEETESLLQAVAEVKDDNFEPVFRKFPSKTAEEVVYHFLNLPFSKITNLNIFGSKKNSKASTLTIDQREAINTMIAQDVNALDDYNNPIIQHAAVFKMFLDKVKHTKQIENDKNTFKHERAPEVDSVLGQLNEVSEEHKETIVELEEHLKQNSKDLRQQAEAKIKAGIKVLIELQLNKIEQKVSFLDEYEKSIFHELKLLDLYRNHLKVERVKQEAELRA